MSRPISEPYRPLSKRIKEKPLRVIESPSGKVFLVEWMCPACLTKGCKECKFRGVMDGITRAIYNEKHYPKY